MTHSPDRLTPEERDLASRLARLGPHGEPPAALDARILSAAHAAVAAPPARRRHWPAILGVAATLALAIGITWQLRPRPDSSPVLQEGPPANQPHATGTAQPVTPNVGADAPAEQTATAEPLPDGAPADASGVAGAPSPAPRATQRTTAPPPQAPPAVVETQEAGDVAELPSFAPAPPATATPAPAAAVSAPPPPPAPAPPTTKARATPALETVTVTGSAATAERAASAQPVVDDTLSPEPFPRIGDRSVRELPIEEDARLGASDWLDRIRLRLAVDDLTGARASLALFRRYYPDRPIPEDLAPLAQ